MDFEIEKGIPLIDKARSPGRTGFYPFRRMDIGDSFLVEDVKKGHSGVSTANVRLNPKKFAARKVEGGLRIWRIA